MSLLCVIIKFKGKVIMMFTQSQLTQQIRSLGIKSDDVLTVHTSLKSVGKLDTGEKTGAEVLIDSLRDAVADGQGSSGV